MDPQKQCLIVSFVNFLQDELQSQNLNEERKESVEVAIQCLETAFEITNETRDELKCENVDLLSLVPYKPKVEVSDEAKLEAEECKNRGNNFMRNSDYSTAVQEYTNAIHLNPYNAVYYCNRAAAFSRLEKHEDSISDCKEAIKLDPTYSKAYSRLGIAYSNLNKFEDARNAYVTALKYDPTNEMYETNLKLAEEKLYATMGNQNENAAPPQHRPVDISQFINNPNLINVATQMMSDPNFRSMMSGLISMNPNDNVHLEQNFMNAAGGSDPRFDVLLQAGQTLANRLQSADPNFVESLRRSLNPETPGNGTNQSQQDPSNDQHPPSS